ncbi:MAG: hypothetical protein EBT03_07435 [Betaproteobacteria bacterium]|nr:hypothetical protein [Betaproteobacteria bacterium]NCA17004.1 hypothetical protein [Betaproteobacteria bacterium]
MSKRKQQHERPAIVSMDELAIMSDEELAGRASRLEGERRRVASSSSELRPWEEEIAYVRREQALREDRSKAHAAYMAAYRPQADDVRAPIEEEEEEEYLDEVG